MKTFVESFDDITRLASCDIKPLGAKLGKLMEETGELAECVNIHMGYITHKTMKEPLVGEVADVVQNALAILVDATPGLTNRERLELFLAALERKNDKWEAVQEGDEQRAKQRQPAWRSHRDGDDPGVENRVIKIIAEQLGVPSEFMQANLDKDIVRTFGADDIDIAELFMALEDEFDIQISDVDADLCSTSTSIINLITTMLNNIAETNEDYGMEECDSIEGIFDSVSNQPQPDAYFDPAADYTARTGRSLTLTERMTERSIYNQRKN